MIIKAFIPCIRWEKDAETESFNIIGVLKAVACEGFPCLLQGNLFIRLTDHAGPLELTFHIVRLSDGSEIARGRVPDAPPIPDRVADFDFSVKFEVSIPAPGDYEIQVIGHGVTAQAVVKVQHLRPK